MSGNGNDATTATATTTATDAKRAERPYNINVTSIENARIEEVEGRKVGKMRVNYLTASDNRRRSVEGEAHGVALKGLESIISAGSYQGPMYGVFADKAEGKCFRVINALPSPSRRAA